ncbi:MAG: hypothetical protein J6P79_03860 [Pseudobutyrivibrio sp.]|nr:hypothetical protein [Pseudobutyrivibrio sp.]
MTSLAKRSAKYFFKEGLKLLGIVLGLECILVIEWIIIGSDKESFMDYLFQMLMSVGCIVVILMNMLYSFYGPNWFDSLVLSMGARRKDIFVGELIKQLTFVGGNFVIYTILMAIFGKYEYLLLNLLASLIAFALGPVGLLIGYNVHSHGKVVIIVVALIGGIGGGLTGFASASNIAFSVGSVGGLVLIITIIASIIIFAASEFWVYKLNQKSMVR